MRSCRKPTLTPDRTYIRKFPLTNAITLEKAPPASDTPYTLITQTWVSAEWTAPDGRQRTGPPGSEGGRTEKDQRTLLPRRPAGPAQTPPSATGADHDHGRTGVAAAGIGAPGMSATSAAGFAVIDRSSLRLLQ